MNESDSYFDSLLTAALYSAAELDYADTISTEELDNIIQPTLRFQQKMDSLLMRPRSYLRSKQRPLYLRIIRAAAAVIITFTVLLSAAMVVSPTVRAAVVNFVRTWLTDRTIYQIPQRELGKSLTFNYMPDGFVLIDEFDSNLQQVYVYKNEDSVVIFISISSGTLIVDNERSEFYSTTINGFHTDIYESVNTENPNVIVVRDEGNGIFITVESEIEIIELTKIVENIS